MEIIKDSKPKDKFHKDEINIKKIKQQKSLSKNKINSKNSIKKKQQTNENATQQNYSHDRSSASQSQQQQRQGFSLNQYLSPQQLNILTKIQQSGIDAAKDPIKHYKKITMNLKDQNLKLVNSLRILKQKVEILKQKQSQKIYMMQKNKNKYHPSRQYFELKKKLNVKYEQLNKWQKKVNRGQYKLIIQLKFKDYINKLIQLQLVSSNLISELKIEYKMNKNIKKQFRSYNKEISNYDKNTRYIEQQNRQLKKRIHLLRKITNSQQSSQIQIHSYNIDMKQRVTKMKQLIKYEIQTQSKLQKIIQEKRKTIMIDKQKQKQKQKQTNNINKYNNIFYEDDNYQYMKRSLWKRNKQQQNQLIKHRTKTQMSAVVFDKDNRKFNNKTSMNNHSSKFIFKTNRILNQAKQHQSVHQDKKKLTQNTELNDYLKTADLSKFIIKRSNLDLHNLSLNRVVQLNNLQNYQLIKYKQKSLQIINKLQIHKNSVILINNPIYRRSGQSISYKKQKQILLIKNTLLLQTLKKLNQSKIQKLIDMIQIKQLKQNQMEQIRILKQQINKQKMLQQQTQQYQRKKQQQSNEILKLLKKKQYIDSLKQKAINTFQQIHNAGQQYNCKYDYMGQIQMDNLDFDDRFIDWYNQSYYIKQMTIYWLEHGIVMVRCKYKQVIDSKQSKNKKIGLDLQEYRVTEINKRFKQKDSILKNKKIQISTTELSVNDYISQIKVIYNRQSGVFAKMQIISKFNVRYECGDRRLSFPTALEPSFIIGDQNNKMNLKNINIINDKKYRQKSKLKLKLNDEQEEFPSFMFGSYHQVNGIPMLSGLGFKINSKKQ